MPQPLDYRPPHKDSERPATLLEWVLATFVATVFLSIAISLFWYLLVA
jgi:hypothetical protein